MKTLLIGFGNPDRQDDGAAWHTLLRLAKAVHYPIPEDFNAGFSPLGQDVDFLSLLQLTPEVAETISAYDRVYFIDAHTGDQTNDLVISDIEPRFQRSPLTHHMTPETCLDLARTMYNRQPKSTLVSIKGYLFEFEDELSPQTSDAVDQAVLWLLSQIKVNPSI